MRVRRAGGEGGAWRARCPLTRGARSGVAVLVKTGLTVLRVELDTVGDLNEGRTITLELECCHVVAAYVPNSGQGLPRLDYRVGTWDPAMRAHLTALELHKPSVLLGDLNVRRPSAAHPDPRAARAPAHAVRRLPRPSVAPRRRRLRTSTPTSGTSGRSTSPSRRGSRRVSARPSARCSAAG